MLVQATGIREAKSIAQEPTRHPLERRKRLVRTTSRAKPTTMFLRTEYLSKTQTTFFLLIVLFISYVANGRTTPYEYAGDTIPNRLIPFSILRFGTPTLDPFSEHLAAAGGHRWFVRRANDHLVSFYPIGAAIVALPLYAAIYVGVLATGPASGARLFAVAPAAEKAVASFIAALSAVLLYLTIRRRTGDTIAAWTALTFGLASSMWATASQLLWQHGPAVLSIVSALWFFTWPTRRTWTFVGAGTALAFATMARPSAAVFALAGAAFIAFDQEPGTIRVRRLLLYAAGALPVIVLNTAYNWIFFESPLGMYGGVVLARLSMTGMADGVPGLLLSPNRGLLIFTPISLLGVVGIVRVLAQRRPDRLLALFALASIAHLALVGSYRVWWGGWSFGPRYLIEVLPTLALAGAYQWTRIGPVGKRMAWAAIVWSFLVQFNGAFAYPASRWDARMSEIGLERAAWDWSHFSLWEDAVAWWRLGKDAPRF